MTATVENTSVKRVLDLLERAPADPDLTAGYLDLLGPQDEPARSPAQAAMQSTFLPQIYEKVWRPVGFNLAKGWPIGPDTATEQAMVRDRLGLGRPHAPDAPAATVLDVACGPGNTTRALAAGVGEGGLTVGLDASATMLARAVADTRVPDVAYVRGDAADLPFRDAAFDSVSCLGALYLFDDPWAAVDGMTRVLKPGGRLVILTSRRPLLPLIGLGSTLVGRAAGLTVFGDREVTTALKDRGYTAVSRHRYPLMQLVSAQRP